MFQPSTNFWGKDPMNWWIGQVTDPEKGKWGDALEKTQAANGEEINGFRCRVRIVGYHDCADDLPDEDLPLAHILLPPNTATTGGCGETVQYQGGEVVVGFFIDGEDAQQPVIFGTLFKQPFVRDQLTTSQFNAKKQTCFVPYTPPKVVQTAGKQQQFQESPWQRGFTAGELFKSVAMKQKEAATNIVTDTFSPCEDNEISKISNAIKDFTRKAETLQELNEASTYIDPIYGGIVDIKSEVQLTTNRIHNSMTKLVRRGRSWLIQETLDKLDKTMEEKTDKFNQVVLGQATNALTSVIFCNIEKIQEELQGYLSKSLENMIGQVLDVPTCGIENFMSDMFGQINNLIDSSLGGMFDQLNNIQGGGIALPSETFSKAIKFANILTNTLDCDKANCPPEPTSYSSKSGVTKSIEDSFDNIINKVGLNQKLTPLIDTLDDAIDASPSRPDCNTNVLKCGPPRVDFIGGGGQGVTGSAVVNALGNIIGVAINGTGFGFEEPPLLSFFDSCDKGYSAGGYPVMGNVSPLRYTEFDRQRDLSSLNQSTKIIPNGKQVGDVVIDNNQNSNKIKDAGLEVKNTNLPVYVSDPNGVELGVVGVVITNPGQEYLSSITETDINGNIKELVPDPNENYDGKTSYVTSLGDVVIDSVGFGYSDGDTATVSGGSVDSAGNTLPGGATVVSGVPSTVSITNGGSTYGATGNNVATTGGTGTGLTVDFTSLGGVVDGVTISAAGTGYTVGDTITITGGGNNSTFTIASVTGANGGVGGALPGGATGDIIQKPAQAEVELNIQNGYIVGATVVNGGSGFTGLPDITINSDTGAGAKIRPVLKFTKVDEASQLVDTNTPFNRNLPVMTVISCIEK